MDGATTIATCATSVASHNAKCVQSGLRMQCRTMHGRTMSTSASFVSIRRARYLVDEKAGHARSKEMYDIGINIC